MTETPQAPAKRTRAGGGLSAMLLADLKTMAVGLGIKGTSSMKKAQLIDAIKGAQSQGGSQGPSSTTSQGSAQASSDGDRGQSREHRSADRPAGPPQGASETEQVTEQPRQETRTRQRSRGGDQQRDQQARGDQSAAGQQGGSQGDQHGRAERQEKQEKPDRSEKGQQSGRQSQGKQGKQKDQQKQDQKSDQQRQDGKQDRQDSNKQDRQDSGKQDQNKQDQNRQDQNRQDQNKQDADQDDEQGSRRNRRRRGRDRERSRGGSGAREAEPQILDDDVLVPAAGIVDVLDNYAFVRTSDYLAGADDVYLAMSMVRRYGLRPGDAVSGQVRQPREGERKEKFNPMVRIDSVNGADPEQAKHRVEFTELTPLFPDERLRMETDAANLTGRIIDLAAPIGKGQRGLVVSPAKSGKTSVLRSIARSVTANNPECHLMVVLVDERPEEITEFQREVKGEVIASTFDRPPSDHTAVAELAIERAKRLVELGHDVVVLLDGLTRLGRAYNHSLPSNRQHSMGIDPAALYPPKRFFGAARNIENGGSLTIIATAQVESGSVTDEMIFEELEATANMELRLRRELADERIFPTIDAVHSGTRREELLLSEQELAVVWKLRRVLAQQPAQRGQQWLVEQLERTRSNVELLMQIQRTTPEALTDSVGTSDGA